MNPEASCSASLAVSSARINTSKLNLALNGLLDAIRSHAQGEAAPSSGAGVVAAPLEGAFEAKLHSGLQKARCDWVAPADQPTLTRLQRAQPFRGYGQMYSQTPPNAPGPSAPMPGVLRPALSFAPVETLTACMDSAPCPDTARRIYRVLYGLALDVVRVRGLPVCPTVAEFHLPLELLAAHLEISRETLWRNLGPLIACGVLAAVDHYGTLDGRTAVTGKIWAVTLNPAKVLAGTANKARVSADALKFPWRNLDRDRREGRTVYNLTRTPEQQASEKARREAQQGQTAEAQQRANQRKAERVSAKARGERPLTGRAAATANAAQTRAAKPAPSAPKARPQQSLKRLKAVDRGELQRWALAPFVHTESVTLTVASGPASALDAMYTLPALAGLSKRARGAAVEASARTLAASFGDTDNLRFWCWLLWQMLRASDQGQNWADDIRNVLARVLHDLNHDDTMNSRTAKCPAALVVAALSAAGLIDALRQIAPTRVGVRPETRTT